MSSRLKMFGVSIAMVTVMSMAVAGVASASTFCVPAYSTACPNNGTNIEVSNLETAMGTNSHDGIADTIYMGAYTYTDSDTLSPPDLGTDDLRFVGSGTDKSFITSSYANNAYVLNLSHRKVDMTDVTIVIPASFPDSGGNGAALQATDGTFDHVDIKSLNVESNAAPSLSGDTSWNNSHIYGASGGSIDQGFQTNIGPGRLEITNTTIDNAVWGIVADEGDIPVIVKRSRINNPIGYGAIIENGSKFVMENSVIVAGNTPAIFASTGNNPGEEDIDASIRASTIIAGKNPATSALKVGIKNVSGSQSGNIDVSDSIIRGFANTWDLTNPATPGIGKASISLTSSDFNPVGLPAGQTTNVNYDDPSNINADPKFTSATDFHLLPGSPAIDAGATTDTGIVTDIDGTTRPLDGNGDGTRVRDMGAFEAPEIPTCKTDPTLCPVTVDTDKTAPVISKVRFKSAKRKAGFLKFTLSEAATTRVAFKPTKTKSKGKKRRPFTRTLKAGAGQEKITLKKGKLKPGRYALTITATDAAGNSSMTKKRIVRVKKAK